MMTEKMEIKIHETFPQPKETFFALMEKVDGLFAPPISEATDLEVYSDKLYTRASFVICRNGNEITAFTAFYKNREAKQLYISLICVDKSFQRQGLGKQMLDMLSGLKAEGFESIGLEVVKTNISAYNFYKKYGFVEQEDRGLKFLMVKNIL